MHQALPLACFLSMIRPPGVEFENALLQIAPVNKGKCPLVRDRNDVGFLLYTRQNRLTPQELLIDDDEALFASNIDFHLPTVFYFHAFMETPIEGSAIMVREAYMLRGDTNFIMVDAQRLEAGPWYITAAQNTWFIGKFAAKFIDYLVSRGLDLSNTHLVGHSLGGQSAGVAGSSITSGRVSRITALDPALPLFDKVPNDQKLDPSDAEFVDVIHTDAGIFGYVDPIGHVDFFPNGGISPQPGCELEVVIPQQMLFNKSTGARTCFSRNPSFGHEPSSRADVTLGINIKGDSALMSKLPIWASGLIDSKKNVQLNGYYQFYLKPNKRAILSNQQRFITELEKFFLYIQGLKDENRLTDQKHDKKNIMFVKRKNKTNSISFIDEKNDKMNDKVNEKAYDLEIDDQRPQVFTVRPDAKESNGENHISNNNYNSKKAKVMDDIYENVHLIINEQKSLLQDAKNNNQKGKTDVFNKEVIDDSIPLQFNDKVAEIIKKAELVDEIEKINNQKTKSHVIKRQKRFIFRRTEAEEDENFLFKMLNFLLKNRRNILPVYTVVREINTLVKSGQGELNHSTKEKNNFIGAPPPLTTPITYTLELGNESRLMAFTKRLLGLTPKGDRLTIGTGKR